jgi:hypothetical protein
MENEANELLAAATKLAEDRTTENAKLISKVHPELNDENDITQRNLTIAKISSETGKSVESVAKENPEPKNKRHYPNLHVFVKYYLSKIYATGTMQSDRKIWLTDWWKYPAIVMRLQNLWTEWEKAYQGGSLMEWTLRVGDPTMHALMDRDNGIMKHYLSQDPDNNARVAAGEYLYYDKPPRTFIAAVAKELEPPELARDSRKRKESDGSI